MTDADKPGRPTFSHGRTATVVSGRKATPTIGVVPKRRRPPDAGSCPVEPAPRPRPPTPVGELVGDE